MCDHAEKRNVSGTLRCIACGWQEAPPKPAICYSQPAQQSGAHDSDTPARPYTPTVKVEPRPQLDGVGMSPAAGGSNHIQPDTQAHSKPIEEIIERVSYGDADPPTPYTSYQTVGASGSDPSLSKIACPIDGSVSTHVGSNQFYFRCTAQGHLWWINSLGNASLIADVNVKGVQVGGEPYSTFVNSPAGVSID